ncbi:MAG: hypothetical protein DRO40_09550, partial [Thermoprotei archaeon]
DSYYHAHYYHQGDQCIDELFLQCISLSTNLLDYVIFNRILKNTMYFYLPIHSGFTKIFKPKIRKVKREV